MQLGGGGGEMNMWSGETDKRKSQRPPLGWWRAGPSSNCLTSCPIAISEVRSCPGRNVLSFKPWNRSEAEMYNPKMSVEEIAFKHLLPELACLPSPGPSRCVLGFLSPCWVGWMLEIHLKNTTGIGLIKLKKGKGACYSFSVEYFSVLFLGCFFFHLSVEQYWATSIKALHDGIARPLPCAFYGLVNSSGFPCVQKAASKPVWTPHSWREQGVTRHLLFLGEVNCLCVFLEKLYLGAPQQVILFCLPSFLAWFLFCFIWWLYKLYRGIFMISSIFGMSPVCTFLC